MSKRFRGPAAGSPQTGSLFGEGSSSSRPARFNPYGGRRLPPGSVRPESDGHFEEPPWPRPDPKRPQPPGPLMTIPRYEELMQEISSNRNAATATHEAGYARNTIEFTNAQRADELRLGKWQSFLLPNGERPPDQIYKDGIPMNGDVAQIYRTRLTQYQLRQQQETSPEIVAEFGASIGRLQAALARWDAYDDEFREAIHTNEMVVTAWPVYDQVYLGGLSRYQMPDWKGWKGEESAYRFKYGRNAQPSNPFDAASRARDQQRRASQPAFQPPTLPAMPNPGTGPTPFSNQMPSATPHPAGAATPGALLGLGRGRGGGGGRGGGRGGGSPGAGSAPATPSSLLGLGRGNAGAGRGANQG